MYIKLNGEKYADVKRTSYRSVGKVVYIGESLAGIEEVSGEIEVYRDDDFLLCTDKASDYARHIIAEGVITMTNEPELQPVPESDPEAVEEPTQLDRIEAQVTYTAMMTDTLLPEESAESEEV